MRFGENFCPGVLHAVEAKDGLLIRIRVPGGLIRPDQLRTAGDVAERFADGNVEITSRSNLQLRGIRREDHGEVLEEIQKVGLLPSATHERVRNIVASPFAGLESDEFIDTSSLVMALDERLRNEAMFAGLHPKFTMGIYGGNRRYGRDVDDVSVSAIEGEGTVLLRLWLAGVATSRVMEQQNAVTVVLAATKMSMMLAKEYGVPARMRQILSVRGSMEQILSGLDPWVTTSGRGVDEIIGEAVCPGIRRTKYLDRVSILPTVPLGRLRASQARVLADIAVAGKGDLRLAPWRGVVLGSTPLETAEEVACELKMVGLPCDGSDGFHGIAACAGINGCSASLADVRADAAVLAARIASDAVVSGWSVNLSGCEKQCGRRRGAVAELVATISGYNLSIDGVNGKIMKQDCTVQAAIDEIALEHWRLQAEVASG